MNTWMLHWTQIFRLMSNVSHWKRMRRVGLRLQMQVMVVSWMEDLQK